MEIGWVASGAAFMSGAGEVGPRQEHCLAAERVDRAFPSFFEVVRACQDLNGAEVLTALRQRRLPMPVQPHAVDLLAALQHVFGGILISRAQDQLNALHPDFSAKGCLSRKQRRFLVGLAVFCICAFIAAPKMAFSLTMLVLAVLFLTGTGVRLW